MSTDKQCAAVQQTEAVPDDHSMETVTITPPTPQYRVFVSYSHDDQKTFQDLKDEARSAALVCVE